MTGETVNLVVAICAIVAAVVGPIAAVVITLVWERVRKSREERQLILQTLLATRGRHADPGYSWAIRTTPLHFARNKDVITAHAAYMDAVRLQPTAENRERADAEIGRRQGVLISEMLKDLGYRGLTAEQIEAYTAQGLADREELLMQALRALPHIAISAKRSADASEELIKRMPPPQ
ncbi:MAG TPA: hypothetical protein PLS69_04965 [Terricaulis sp.]|nr:hypothetical protein [Terricaulis sp.]HRP10550.1 hypothetical protein [Terricaulis sp.]